MRNNFSVLTIICLFVAEIILELHEEVKWINLPYYLYVFTYYCRAILSISCVFLGGVKIINKIKDGYFYLAIGLLLSITSVAPAVMSLYFINSTDLHLLSISEQQTYENHIHHQKQFLLIIGSIAAILAALFYLRRKKHT